LTHIPALLSRLAPTGWLAMRQAVRCSSQQERLYRLATTRTTRLPDRQPRASRSQVTLTTLAASATAASPSTRQDRQRRLPVVALTHIPALLSRLAPTGWLAMRQAVRC